MKRTAATFLLMLCNTIAAQDMVERIKTDDGYQLNYLDDNLNTYKIERFKGSELVHIESTDPETGYLEGSFYDGNNYLTYDENSVPYSDSILTFDADHILRYYRSKGAGYDEVIIVGLRLGEVEGDTYGLYGSAEIYGIIYPKQSVYDPVQTYLMSSAFGVKAPQYNYIRTAGAKPLKELIGRFQMRGNKYHGKGFLIYRNDTLFKWMHNRDNPVYFKSNEDIEVDINKKTYRYKGELYFMPKMIGENQNYLRYLKEKSKAGGNLEAVKKFSSYPEFTLDILNEVPKLENKDIEGLDSLGFTCVYYTDTAVYLSAVNRKNIRSSFSMKQALKKFYYLRGKSVSSKYFRDPRMSVKLSQKNRKLENLTQIPEYSRESYVLQSSRYQYLNDGSAGKDLATISAMAFNEDIINNTERVDLRRERKEADLSSKALKSHFTMSLTNVDWLVNNVWSDAAYRQIFQRKSLIRDGKEYDNHDWVIETYPRLKISISVCYELWRVEDGYFKKLTLEDYNARIAKKKQEDEARAKEEARKEEERRKNIQIHVMTINESFADVAKKYNLTEEELLMMNFGSSFRGYSPFEGMQLKVTKDGYYEEYDKIHVRYLRPEYGGWRIGHNELTLKKFAKKFGYDKKRLKELNPNAGNFWYDRPYNRGYLRFGEIIVID